MDDITVVVSSHPSDVHMARLIRKFISVNIEGVELWTYEQSLQPGLEMKSQVRFAIRKAAIVIFLFSPAYIASDEFAHDRALATPSSHLLIPIVVRPCETSSSMNREMGMKRPKWIDISAINSLEERPRWEQVLEDGMNRLRALIETVVVPQPEEDAVAEDIAAAAAASALAADAVDGPEEGDFDSAEGPGDALDGPVGGATEDDEAEDKSEFDTNFIVKYGVQVKKSPLDTKHHSLPLTQREIGCVRACLRACARADLRQHQQRVRMYLTRVCTCVRV
jgi:hypothetical protein